MLGRFRINLLAGLFVMAIGAVTVWEGNNHAVGQLNRMGPGFVPIALGVLMLLLGVAITCERQLEGAAVIEARFRPILFLSAGIIAFALLLERAGLVAAVLACVLLFSLTEKVWHPTQAILTALGLAVGITCIFVVGIGMTIPVWPVGLPWTF